MNNPVNLAQEYTAEILLCERRSVGVKRGCLIGRIVHHVVASEGAPDADASQANLSAACVVLDGLRAIRATAGDFTGSVGRLTKYVDEAQDTHARKWGGK